MWYNKELLRYIIMFWHPEYEDVQIEGINYNDSILDMIVVNFVYKSEFLIYKRDDDFCYSCIY